MLVLPTLLLLCLAAPAETTTCDPIDGIDVLLKPGRVVLLGELHGTVESPRFVLDVACRAATAGLDVVVGLELSPAIAGDVAKFLRSEATPADREALLAGGSWQGGYQDGRTSRAMADLIDGLARLRRIGHSVRVVPFDAQPAGGGQTRERAMAANLAATADASPEALLIVLTGNQHSRITKGGRAGAEYEPMGYVLSRSIGRDRVTSLNVSHAGGTAWVCSPDCGIARLRGHGDGTRWRVEIDDATRPAGHDGFYTVGTLSASPPANGRYDDVASVAAAPRVSPRDESSPGTDPAEPFPVQTSEILEPFQGAWQAYQYGSKAWTLEIEEQRFRGVLGPDDWYEGRIRLRPDVEPAQIDFMIEDCRCNYRGMTSQGIFRLSSDGDDDERDGSILLAAPAPGNPRPVAFSPSDGRTVELRRVAAE